MLVLIKPRTFQNLFNLQVKIHVSKQRHYNVFVVIMASYFLTVLNPTVKSYKFIDPIEKRTQLARYEKPEENASKSHDNSLVPDQ